MLIDNFYNNMFINTNDKNDQYNCKIAVKLE